MIKLLAKFFRGLHLIIGISEPPTQNDRSLVLMWLGIIALTVGSAALALFFVLHVLNPAGR
jgi:hypothetical protein